nr:HPr family phosphocarrier protein [Oribacterium sp. C9]
MMKDTNVVVNLPKKSDDHPVAMLVQIASRYESRIYMADGPRKVNAKSIMGMMALGINNGQELVVSAEGSDEADAVTAISEYLRGEAV